MCGAVWLAALAVAAIVPAEQLIKRPNKVERTI
jgi:hypothetical protein